MTFIRYRKINFRFKNSKCLKDVGKIEKIYQICKRRNETAETFNKYPRQVNLDDAIAIYEASYNFN